MKYLILILAIFLIIPFASASNTTIPIFADYKVNNLYTLSNAKLNIINPTGSVLLYNQSMNEMSKGRFNYTYSCNETGVYSATAIFYNKTTAKELGSANSEFSCGNIDGWEIGSCPNSDIGIITFWIFLFFMLLLAGIGIAFNISSLVVFAGIVLFIIPFISGFCYEFVSYAELMLGLVFIGVGFNIRS